MEAVLPPYDVLEDVAPERDQFMDPGFGLGGGEPLILGDEEDWWEDDDGE